MISYHPYRKMGVHYMGITANKEFIEMLIFHRTFLSLQSVLQVIRNSSVLCDMYDLWRTTTFFVNHGNWCHPKSNQKLSKPQHSMYLV